MRYMNARNHDPEINLRSPDRHNSSVSSRLPALRMLRVLPKAYNDTGMFNMCTTVLAKSLSAMKK